MYYFAFEDQFTPQFRSGGIQPIKINIKPLMTEMLLSHRDVVGMIMRSAAVKKIIAILSMGIILTACGGGGGDSREPHPFNPTPTLIHFDIVDSYGIDTATSSQLLALNPYLYNGLFDIFWDVNSIEDYRINVRINDRPTVTSSFLIYSEICGEGAACDQEGNVICEYTSDLTLSCNNASNPTDISALFSEIPQELYLVFEVCDMDSPYCEFNYHKVLME
ncbi:MAG: hypothetical protein EOO68_12955 [Moraxellaceae bacterium]|nr:MAG: hypothetical protein EOO68_12955 [Moraxellaceae bacterium]